MADATPVALDLRDHVAFQRDRVVVLPVADAPGLGLAVVCLEPGQILDAQLADGDVLLTVVGGRAWVVVDDAEVVLQPLQAVLVPSGAAYGVRNDSADPLILQRVAGSSSGSVPQGSAPPAHPAPAPRNSAADPPSAAGPDADADADPDPGPVSGGRFARLRRLLGSG